MLGSLEMGVLLLIPEVAVICYLLVNILQLMIHPKKQTTVQNIGILASFFTLAAFLPEILSVTSSLSQNVAMKEVAAGILSNGYQVDGLAIFTKSMILLGSALILLFSQRFLAKHPYSFEFLTIFALLILGQMITVSAVHTLVLYLGIELMALASCGLVALSSIQPKQAPFAKEAAIKYIVMGAVASGFLLFGLSFWYGAFGVLDYQTIQQMIINNQVTQPAYVTLGLALIIVGFAFKLGLVPFHAWVPDVYQGASYPITMILAAIPKVVACVMFYRFFYQANIGFDAQQLILIQSLAILSIIIANALGMVQVKIRRLLAYSTISNMGLMLLILPLGEPVNLSDTLGFISINQASATALYYVFIYALTSLLTFAVLITLNQNNGIEDLNDLKGLSRKYPKVAMILSFLMLSMMGLPPFIGFYPKLASLNILITKQQYVFAVLVVLASVMAAFYYLKIIKYMYFDAPINSSNEAGESGKSGKSGKSDKSFDSAELDAQTTSIKLSPILIFVLLGVIFFTFMPMQPLSWFKSLF
jgi:NADH-quinone oxidoreductase subunit N